VKLTFVCSDVSGNSLVRTYPIAKVLARRHEVQVLGFSFGDGVFPPYRDEFVYEYQVARRLPAFVWQAAALSRKVRGDAMYVFKPLPSSLWVALLAKRRLGIPLFLDIEDWELAWYLDVPRVDQMKHAIHAERPNGLLWTWVTEMMSGRADEVFVVSRFLQRKFGGTLLVHGADTNVFDPSLWPPDAARATIGLPEGRWVVFTGSPMPSKGLGDLLQAVVQIGDPSLRVLVVGTFGKNTDYQRQLIDRYGDRLMVMGPRPHSEMPMFLAAADVVALPQRLTRTMAAQVPGKIFEAMAMAKPILATAVSDLPEILDGCGVVVPPGSVDQLAAGLEWILKNPVQATDLGRKARQRCEDRYSWNAMECVLTSVLTRWEKPREP
jgi:glycosyltransferase involved in cell wall biosynthesis